MAQSASSTYYRVNPKESPFRLKITDHILDNVYGHIGITTVERKLERLPLFKRLHNVSQLGLTNLIFPCALHTRYVHSIGVMHMASEMAKHINENVDPRLAFSDLEIQILRLTGMLHDIGHYPMSHNIEQAYKTASNPKREEYMLVFDHLKELIGCPDYLSPNQIDKTAKDASHYWKNVDYSESDYSGSKGYHHEAIGQRLIENNLSIRDTVRDYFVTYTGKNGIRYIRKEFIPPKERKEKRFTAAKVNRYTSDLLKMISAIIIGNYEYGTSTQADVAYEYKKKFSAMIQLLHSELDADNIDYLLRDALFSGTSYGFMDVSVLLNCLTMVPFKHKSYPITNKARNVTDYLVGIQPKGIGCVDQFFQNKYLAYTQMIMNKYVSSVEFMLLRWAQTELTNIEMDCYGIGEANHPNTGLFSIVDKAETSIDYLRFTDACIMNMLFSQHRHYLSAAPTFLKIAISRLTNYTAFEMNKSGAVSETYDVSCAGLGEAKIAEQMRDMEAYQQFRDCMDALGRKKISTIRNTKWEKDLYSYRFEEHRMTKQLPYNDFYRFAFKKADGSDREMDDKRAFQNHFFRLTNGIPVLRKEEYTLKWEKKIPYDAKSSIPELVVDCPGSHLHNTYNQITVFLRRYKIDLFE